MKERYSNLVVVLLVLTLTVALLGCGGGSSSGTTPGPGTVSGTVQAPNGSISFNWPAHVWRKFARLFVRDAVAQSAAGLPGVTPVGAGVTVNLIRIDSSGAQVGQPLATATTDSSGNYTLAIPTGVTLGPNYVIEAGSSGSNIQAFATGASVNVDPYSHAAVGLITGAVTSGGVPIASVSSTDIAAVLQTVLQTSGDVATSSTTASQLSTDLKTTIGNNVESNNIVNSIAAAGTITGTVTDSGGAPVAGIQIMVRTFGDQTTMAITRTDASGNYTVHVPANTYVVGAINDTTASTAASLWWTSTGGTTNTFLAEKVTVGATPVTTNFSLPAGGRISGTVTAAATGGTLPGIQVTLCDFSTGQTLMWVTTKPDGAYTFNVAPGSYFLTFRNQTLAQYGTGIWNSTIPGGGTNKTQAEKIVVTAGANIAAGIALVAGGKITGYVTTNGSTAVPGMAVRFQDSTGSYAEATRTGLDGGYRMWVQPAGSPYNVLSRGQQYSGVATSPAPLGPAVAVTAGGSATASFGSTMGAITATVKDTGGNPVGGVNVYIYDTTGSYNMLGWEITGGDGSVTLYGASATNFRVAFIVFDGRMLASQAYNSGGLVPNYPTGASNVTAPSTLGTITLPAGGFLSGTVTKGGSLVANALVQIRLGGKTGLFRLLTTRTMSDGSYTVSLPVATITRLCAADSSANLPNGASPPTAGAFAYSDTVAITLGSITTPAVLAY